MKKLLIILLILGIFLPTIVIAQTSNELPEPGMTPDNALYFFKIWWEKIVVFLTFNPMKKAEKLLKYAERRLVEAQKMIEKGKTKYVDKLMEQYQKKINQAMEIAQKQEKKGQDVEALMQKVIQTGSKHIQVLNNLLTKVPEAAKKGIQNAISASQKGYQQAIQSISKKRFQETIKKIKPKIPKIKETKKKTKK